MDSIKREYPRRQENIKAMIHIHLDESDMGALSLKKSDETIRLMAETKDISWGGVCIYISDPPHDRKNRFIPENAHTLVGGQITVNLTNPKLTLWGDVLRYDSRSKHMAVILSKVSDYGLWQQLCGGYAPQE